MTDNPIENTISQNERALLNDISSVGAKHAALVLSQMLGVQIDVSFQEINVVNFDEAIENGIQKDKLVSFVFSKFHGDVNGTVVVFFSKQSTLTILKTLFNRKVNSLDKLEEIDFSILKETGNIIIGSFFTALGNTYEIMVLPTVPDVAVDNFSAITDSFAIVLYEGGHERLISLRTQLITTSERDRIFGTLMLFFETSDDMNVLMRARRRNPI